MPARTSDTHPIRVDFVPSDRLGVPGRLGMTFAPGKQNLGMTGLWMRDLERDLERLQQHYQTNVLISLLESFEFDRLKIPHLRTAAVARGLESWGFPIPDGGVPDSMEAFRELIGRATHRLRLGQTVVVHCMGGLGRAGTVAASCAVACGLDPQAAIALVREARPGAVERPCQERWIEAFALLP